MTMRTLTPFWNRHASFARTACAAVSAMSALCILLAPARAQDAAPEAGIAPAAQQETTPVLVSMQTTEGTIVLELNEDKAPITVANFLGYVGAGHYDGTVFHRVISTFMIQGGGFTTEGTEKPTGDPIKNEFRNGLSNVRGTIAMARTSDPDSATAQFYINVADNAALDTARRETGGAGYCVFGKVVHGMDVVDAIRNVPTGVRRTRQGGMPDWPVDDVVITKAERITPEQFETMKAEAAEASGG